MYIMCIFVDDMIIGHLKKLTFGEYIYIYVSRTEGNINGRDYMSHL